MIGFFSREEPRPLVALLAVLAVLGLSCLACRPFLNSVWYEMSCDGLGILGNGFLIESLGIEYHSPNRDFPIQDLLLDESAFPDGWQAREPFDPEDGLPAEQIALGFYVDSDADASLGAGHEAYRFYGGTRCADMGYRSKIPIWFAPWQGYGPWAAPAELSYHSPVANRFRLECCTREGSSVQTCQAIGQYEEYVVVFRTGVDTEYPSHMSFTDLEQILVAIDERMALYLGKDTQ